MPDREREPGGARRSGRSRREPREGAFLFGLARREKIKRPGKKPLVQIRFYWKRVFAVLGVLAFLGWLAGGAALYFYFKEHRDYDEVSFPRMLVLPFRMEEHRREMGEFYIRRGMEEIKEGEFRTGFHHLRTGLARAPANAAARIMLARIFYEGYRDNRLAVEALLKGLPHAGRDPEILGKEYLYLLFALLDAEEADERRIELADELAPRVSDPGLRSFLARQAAAAEIETGRFTAAAARLGQDGIRNSPEGIRLLADLLHRSGEPRRALAVLEDGVERFPADPRISSFFVRLLIERGRWEDLLGHVEFRRILNPGIPAPWLARLQALQNLGRADEVPAAVEEIFERFPEETVRRELLRFAVESNRSDVAEMVLARAAEPETADSILAALAFLKDDRPAKTLALLDALPEEVRDEARLKGLRSAAHAMLDQDEAALTNLQLFLDEEHATSRIYVSVAEIFAERGFESQARRVLAEAVRRHPTDRAALLALLRLDPVPGGSRDRLRHASALAFGRIPPVEDLRGIRDEIVSDRYILNPDRDEVVARIDWVLDQARERSPVVPVSAGALIGGATTD
ncbi:MAG: tetratricopeptide repeat protein [Puniceicoccaceae bacterium]